MGRRQGGMTSWGVGEVVMFVEGTEGWEEGFWVGGAGGCTTAENADGCTVTSVDKVMC